MHPMRLTNKQIQDIITDLRKQLKGIKSLSGKLDISYKIPEQKDKEKATLVFTQIAWSKLTALVDECNKEIAWHGTVQKDGTTYTVTDILVFPQTVTGATVTSDETEYSMWLMQQPDEIFNTIRFHGHSHVNMGVSPSGVDKTYQEDILKNLNDFFIFAIFNKKGDNWCAIYDVESNTVYDDSDITLVIPNNGWAQEQIKRYVKEQTAVPAAAVASKYPINKNKKKANKPKEESNTQYTDYLLDADGDWPGYDYYGYYGYGGYHGQK